MHALQRMMALRYLFDQLTQRFLPADHFDLPTKLNKVDLLVCSVRNSLISKGCIVEWVDPLVAKWENSTPVDISWDCDVAVLVTNQSGMDIQAISDRGVPILDCTNSHSGFKGVTLL